LAFGSRPVTPVASGRPVAFVRTAAEGVPSAGVVRVGEVSVLLVSVCVSVVPTIVPAGAGTELVSVVDEPAIGIWPVVRPEMPVLPLADAHVPSPRQNVEDDAPVPEFRLVTGRLPDTSAVRLTADEVTVCVDPAKWATPTPGEEATTQVVQVIVPVVVMGPPPKGAVVATLVTVPLPVEHPFSGYHLLVAGSYVRFTEQSIAGVKPKATFPSLATCAGPVAGSISIVNAQSVPLVVQPDGGVMV